MIKIHLLIRRAGLLPYLFFLFFKSIIANFFVFLYIKIFVYRKLKYFNFTNYKNTSKTIFILGSGSSVNELTDENWRKIKNNTSIGLNFWIAHKFIPDFLFIEPALEYRGLLSIIEESENRYKNVTFIIKGIESLKFNSTKKLVRAIVKANHKMFFAREIGLPSFNINDLTKSLRILRIIGFFNINILAQSRSSIVLLLYYSIIKGYKEIVLSGIDLCGSYFYEDKNFTLYTVFHGQNNSTLKINSKSKNLIDTESAIVALVKELNKFFDFQIFVTSHNSVLSKYFSIYSFNN